MQGATHSLAPVIVRIELLRNSASAVPGLPNLRFGPPRTWIHWLGKSQAIGQNFAKPALVPGHNHRKDEGQQHTAYQRIIRKRSLCREQATSKLSRPLSGHSVPVQGLSKSHQRTERFPLSIYGSIGNDLVQQRFSVMQRALSRRSTDFTIRHEPIHHARFL